MSSGSADLPVAEGTGSVSGAPELPPGFTDTFTSHYVEAGDNTARRHRRRGSTTAARSRLARVRTHGGL